MIPADFLELLRCPQSGQPLAVADAEVLARVNQRIAQTVGNQADAAAGQPLTAALVRADRTLAYPIRDDIPLLLVEEGILL